MVSGYVCVVGSTMMVWGVTIYPKILSKGIKQQNGTLLPKASIDSDSMTTNENACYGSAKNWTMIIKENIEILHLFMRFLCRSLCVENMLFLIEIMQFKREFIKKRALMKSGGISGGKIDYGIVIDLYGEEEEQQIPKSAIVFSDYTEYSVNEQIRMIFDKYISDSAKLQINLSFADRSQLQELILSDEFMNNHDDEFLIKIMDDAISEIVLLLNGSWLRFKMLSDNLDNIVEQDRSEVNEQIMIAMHKQTTK